MRVSPSKWAVLYNRYFDAGDGQRFQISLGNLAIRYNVMDVGGRGNLTKTAAPKFAGIADHNRPPRSFHHDLIHVRFGKVRGGRTHTNIKPIHRQEKDVRAESAQSLLRQGTHQGERVWPQGSAGEN